MKANGQARSRTIGFAAVLAQLTILLGLLHWAREREPRIYESIVERVPSARSVMSFRGPGFAGTKRGTGFAAQGDPTNSRGTLASKAPALASGNFEVGLPTPWNPIRFMLASAAESKGRIENGLVTYKGAYRSADVLVVHDPERLELAYVVHEPANPPIMQIHFTGGESISAEEGMGSVVIRAAGRAQRLRAEQPIAFDASGRARRGRYAVRGQDLFVEMDFEGLVPPVLVDPTFYIPFWTIADDSRQPGNEVYDPTRLSRETQVFFDGTTGWPTLIRPTRSQQREDTITHFGTLWQPGYPRVQPEPRTPGVQGPAIGPSEYADWTRVHGSESEVWAWHDGRWHLQGDVGLPGLIDSAVAYDAARGRTVLFGGGVPAFSCSGISTILSPPFCVLSASWNWDATYERDASGQWSSRRIPNSPAPRLRAAMASFRDNIVLFGGRALRLGQAQASEEPSPDNLTAELLNDTWLYDGSRWTALAAGNPPPRQEGAQLVLDVRRGRLVLVSGSTGSIANPFDPLTGVPGQESGDSFGLWEFDGTDWLQRFGSNDPALPPALRGRRGVAAVWHPGRQTVLLFGGFVESLPPCPYSGIILRNAQANARSNPALLPELEAQNCVKGYAHDWWEWDGTQIRELARADFAGYLGDGTLPSQRLGLYRQVQGNVPPPGSGAGPGGAASSKLWPWRYDPRPEHFRLRTTLERTYTTPGSVAPPASEPGSSTTLDEPGSPIEFVSPPFVPAIRPHIVYEPVTGELMVLPSPTPSEARATSQVFGTSIGAWEDRTPRASPFDSGLNDFFAATWDTTANRALLFDPRDGSTWESESAGGWRRIAVTNPAPWSGVSARNKKDVESRYNITGARDFGSIARRTPRMTFDRGRGAPVLFYDDALWEVAGTSWESRGMPPGMPTCSVSTLLAYDGARQRTVLVGCTVPAQTWEWNGVEWFGPFPSPYDALVQRSLPELESWNGPLQLPWVHPNAIAELPSLGGVGLLDVDGTLRVWNGAMWSNGPALPEGRASDVATLISANPGAHGVIASGFYFGEYLVPSAAFSPLIEESSAQRLLTFRDGVTGMRQLDLRIPAESRSWSSLILGRPATDPANVNLPYPSVHPHPFELWSPEVVAQTATADPARKLTLSGTPIPDGSEQTLVNLYWPFRVLQDAPRNRLLFLTHRGVLWQFGSEPVGGIGDPCVTLADCGEGVACVNGRCSAGSLGDPCTTLADCASGAHGCFDGVCCNNGRCNARCARCNGTQPGICEPVPRGEPDPRGLCPFASGECALTCPGSGTVPPLVGDFTSPPCAALRAGQACGGAGVCEDGMHAPGGLCAPASNQCVAVAPTPCAGGLGCASSTSCKTTCASRADCRGRFDECRTDGTGCQQDAVSVAATARGVQPSSWVPAAERTPSEVAALLKTLGFEEDEEGRILFSDYAFGGIVPAFNPNMRNPVEGFGHCLGRIHACRFDTNTVDECVAAMPRCVSSTPWLDDPAGFACCPSECLLEYFGNRSTLPPADAAISLSKSLCYPAMQSYLESLR